ncbi:MAG: hypothetical protein MUE60_10780 [Candidatus Eisenbacteria bacterium]|nr:hypothetical protein [Candidatus Eisenbacteria bacterium]
MTPRFARHTHGVAVAAAILTATALALLVVDPRGEFPLNDDWLYARVVQQAAETGRLVRPALASVSLIGPTLCGLAATALTGFSHTALRLSSVALHLTASFATAAAVGRSAGPGHAAFAGLLVLLSPLGLVSAFSFMPEPALEASVALTALAALAWRERQTVMRATALGLAAMSTYLVHPVALVVPLWLLLSVPHRVRPAAEGMRGREPRSPWVRALPGLAALAGSIPFLIWYLSSSTGGTMSGMWISRSSGIDLPIRFLSRCAPVVPYLGLLVLPLGVAHFSWNRTLLPTCFMLWAWGQAWWLGAPPPLPLPSLENLLHSGGLGFVGLQGTPPSLPPWFWMAVSLGSLAAGIGLLGRMLPPAALPAPLGIALAVMPWLGGLVMGHSALRAIAAGVGACAAWAWALRGVLCARGPLALALVWLAALMALPPFYDRYLVPLLPLVVIPMVPMLRRTTVLMWTSLFIVGALSVMGTRDFLTWNRIRWEQIAVLEEQGVNPDEIDGGYEWAGWRHAWKGIPDVDTPAGRSPWWIRLWAPRIVPTYVVSVSPIAGYHTIGSVECPTVARGWRVYVLREAPMPPDLDSPGTLPADVPPGETGLPATDD